MSLPAFPEQIAVLGVLVSSVCGLQLSYFEYARTRDEDLAALLAELDVPQELIANPAYLAIHRQMSASLRSLSASKSETLQRFASQRLTELNALLSEMADEQLVFERTEAWRIAYERLLRNPDVTESRSVAWFRTAAYWQDLPGRQSLQLNCELAEEGLLIHRTVIDGAQEFGQVDHAASVRAADLYLTSGHKWLGGYLPLSIAVYGRNRSASRIETIVAGSLESGLFDDPLLRLTWKADAAAAVSARSTANVAALFACDGAIDDAPGEFEGPAVGSDRRWRNPAPAGTTAGVGLAVSRAARGVPFPNTDAHAPGRASSAERHKPAALVRRGGFGGDDL